MLETMFENALLDYYRGGNSYEDSVKKQLNALEATSLATTFAVSDMKSDLRKELRANTNELHGIRDDIRTVAVGMHNLGQGIRNDIQDMATGVTSAIQENTYAVVANKQTLEDDPLFDKVKKLLEKNDIYNPLAQLTEKEVFNSLNDSEKERYMMDISKRYNKLKEYFLNYGHN